MHPRSVGARPDRPPPTRRRGRRGADEHIAAPPAAPVSRTQLRPRFLSPSTPRQRRTARRRPGGGSLAGRRHGWGEDRHMPPKAPASGSPKGLATPISAAPSMPGPARLGLVGAGWQLGLESGVGLRDGEEFGGAGEFDQSGELAAVGHRDL